jgi:hypothetical protein
MAYLSPSKREKHTSCWNANIFDVLDKANIYERLGQFVLGGQGVFLTRITKLVEAVQDFFSK